MPNTTDKRLTDPEHVERLIEQLRIKATMINLGETIEWGSETTLMDEAAATLRALSAELQEPVEVKPLEWDDRNHAGHYRIEPTYGQDKHPFILMCGTRLVWAYDTVEAAKSAAQAHHEARVRAMLADRGE